jgi:mannitol-1-phosphate 5-dehydrogenase
MLNPLLGDPLERVGRDPRRKLAWSDRLAGTLRLALAAGIDPWRFARGAAAALLWLDPSLRGEPSRAAAVLREIWSADPAAQQAPEEVERVAARVTSALARVATAPCEALFA